MPNWCYNTLEITGPSGDLAHFRVRARISAERADELARDAELVFADGGTDSHRAQLADAMAADDGIEALQLANLVPEPPEVGGPDNSGWSWRIRNWGTKWDIKHVTLTDDVDGDTPSLRYSFDTAWSPVVAWTEHVSEQFPTLTFRLAFAEQGNDAAGIITAQDGNVTGEEPEYGDEVTFFAEHGFDGMWVANEDEDEDEEDE